MGPQKTNDQGRNWQRRHRAADTTTTAFLSEFAMTSAVVAGFAVLLVVFTKGSLLYRPEHAPQPAAAAS